MTFAITGATGQLGRLVIENLKTKVAATDIIALARSPEKAADLGVTARRFDYEDPTALAPALDGVDTLLLISGSDIGRRVPQHLAVIEAARTAGVTHIVYTSLLNAKDSPLALAPEHAATEDALAASGLGHTILRNGWYTENYLMSLPAVIEHKAVIGSAGEGRISAAPRADMAEAAAAVLADPSLQGRTYELAGDESFSLSDLAATISAVTGTQIPYVDMPQAAYVGALTQAGVPEDMAGFLAHCDVEASKGALFHDGPDLSTLLGRPTTGLETVVKAALASGV